MKTIKLKESDLQRIVKRVIKESNGDDEKKKLVNKLLEKIDSLLKYSVERNLENIISTETVKFGFTNNNEFVMVSDTAKMFRGIKFDSDGWGGKFELRSPMMFTLIDSKDYVDVVETQLNDEEKPLFDEVGVVGKVKDKSVREMISDGKIAIVLERGNSPSMMSWKRLNVSSNYSQGEKTACQGLTNFDELGDEISITDILEKGKKICNGGIKISNSGVVLRVFKSPMNNIINHNAG